MAPKGRGKTAVFASPPVPLIDVLGKKWWENLSEQSMIIVAKARNFDVTRGSVVVFMTNADKSETPINWNSIKSQDLRKVAQELRARGNISKVADLRVRMQSLYGGSVNPDRDMVVSATSSDDDDSTSSDAESVRGSTTSGTDFDDGKETFEDAKAEPISTEQQRAMDAAVKNVRSNVQQIIRGMLAAEREARAAADEKAAADAAERQRLGDIKSGFAAGPVLPGPDAGTSEDKDIAMALAQSLAPTRGTGAARKMMPPPPPPPARRAAAARAPAQRSEEERVRWMVIRNVERGAQVLMNILNGSVTASDTKDNVSNKRRDITPEWFDVLTDSARKYLLNDDPVKEKYLVGELKPADVYHIHRVFGNKQPQAFNELYRDLNASSNDFENIRKDLRFGLSLYAQNVLEYSWDRDVAKTVINFWTTRFQKHPGNLVTAALFEEMTSHGFDSMVTWDYFFHGMYYDDMPQVPKFYCYPFIRSGNGAKSLEAGLVQLATYTSSMTPYQRRRPHPNTYPVWNLPYDVSGYLMTVIQREYTTTNDSDSMRWKREVTRVSTSLPQPMAAAPPPRAPATPMLRPVPIRPAAAAGGGGARKARAPVPAAPAAVAVPRDPEYRKLQIHFGMNLIGDDGTFVDPAQPSTEESRTYQMSNMKFESLYKDPEFKHAKVSSSPATLEDMASFVSSVQDLFDRNSPIYIAQPLEFKVLIETERTRGVVDNTRRISTSDVKDKQNAVLALHRAVYRMMRALYQFETKQNQTIDALKVTMVNVRGMLQSFNEEKFAVTGGKFPSFRLGPMLTTEPQVRPVTTDEKDPFLDPYTLASASLASNVISRMRRVLGIVLVRVTGGGVVITLHTANPTWLSIISVVTRGDCDMLVDYAQVDPKIGCSIPSAICGNTEFSVTTAEASRLKLGPATSEWKNQFVKRVQAMLTDKSVQDKVSHLDGKTAQYKELHDKVNSQLFARFNSGVKWKPNPYALGVYVAFCEVLKAYTDGKDATGWIESLHRQLV